LDIAQLQKAIEAHPKLLDSPALKRAIQDVEVQEANERLRPVVVAMQAAIDQCQAEGTLKGVDIPRLKYLAVEVAEDGKTYQVVIRATLPKAKRTGTGGGTSSKVTSGTWKDAGFVSFHVKGQSFGKPIDAIVAAGGQKLETSENYWRVILGKDFSALPIEVEMKDAKGNAERFSLTDSTFRERLGVPLTNGNATPKAEEANGTAPTPEATPKAETPATETKATPAAKAGKQN
jgi:hypothetical protein